MASINATSVESTTSTSFSSSVTSDSTTTSSTFFSSTSVITTSIPPSSTVFVPASSTSTIPPPSSSSVVVIFSTVVSTPPSTAPNQPSTSVLVITSTLPATTPTEATSTSSSSSTSTSSTPSALSASTTGKSSGLGTGGTIAIAVVIPLVVIAGLFFLGLFLWRRRKSKKAAEEERKAEMAEYGFNPNNDQSLVPAASAGAAYAEDASEPTEDNSGYRGWGATSSNRKASTTLGSNGRPGAPTASDGGSQPGGYAYNTSPNQASDHYSADGLMNKEGSDNVGALGAGAAATTGAAALGAGARNRNSQPDVRRGPSNASSAYTNGRAHSEASSDAPEVPGPYYHEEVPYDVYSDAQPHHGPYGDGTYGGDGQAVIRDVQARRNTRIERAPTFPQKQGGIAQNF